MIVRTTRSGRQKAGAVGDEAHPGNRTSRTRWTTMMTGSPTSIFLTTTSPRTGVMKKPSSTTTIVSHIRVSPHLIAQLVYLIVELPPFVLERRGRHKPLSSYFGDAILDREGSVDRETASQLQGGVMRSGKVDTTAGSFGTETPASPAVRSTPLDDESSATGRSNFSHSLAHGTLTSWSQNQKRKRTSKHSHRPYPSGNTPDIWNLRASDRSCL